MIQKFIENEEAQLEFGNKLSSFISDKILIFLEGGLGAGKTTLTRGLIRGKGFHGNVKSPTYTLIEPYKIEGIDIYHIDLYRVNDINELEYLGIRDILSETSIVIIEWPQIGKNWLPEPDLLIQIDKKDNGRLINLTSSTKRGKNILDSYF
tara:strand:+ start:83 stop:535 length:453 start_codon:yes stop_codon:yes gene_type:complete